MSFDTDFAPLLAACYEIQPETLFIFADQNGVEAKPPYCVLTVINEQLIGLAEESLLNINQTTNYVENIRSIIRFTFHGTVNSDALLQAKNFRTKLQAFIGRASLYQHGYSFIDSKILRRTSDPRDTTMYVNTSYDVTLMYKRYSTYNQNSIDEVSVNGEYIHEDNISNIPIDIVNNL